MEDQTHDFGDGVLEEYSVSGITHAFRIRLPSGYAIFTSGLEPDQERITRLVSTAPRLLKALERAFDLLEGIADKLLYEEGQPQKIEVFEPETQQPLDLALMIDASMSTEMLAPGRHPDVDFLFPDYAALERDYYLRTGFFPIMHVLLIRTAILEQNPWVAMSLYNAWQKSKERCYAWLDWQRVHQTALWYRGLWEEERAATGDRDIYPWGFKKNRAELAVMLGYCQSQGMLGRRHEPEEMFWPSTLDT